jgi:hypothetical protein
MAKKIKIKPFENRRTLRLRILPAKPTGPGGGRFATLKKGGYYEL